MRGLACWIGPIALGWTVALGAGGCGEDDSAEANSGADGDTDAAQTSFGVTGGGTEGDSDANDTDPSPTTSATSTTGETGLGDACGDPCGPDAACNPETLACECIDPSQQWDGGGCIPCAATGDADLGVDIPVVDAVFDVTLAGVPAPTGVLEVGELYLQGRDGRDIVALGGTNDGQLTQTVVIGEYDVYYAFDRGGVEMPLNGGAYLGPVFVDDTDAIPIDIPRALVRVTLTINGGNAHDSPTDFGDIVLVEQATGDEVPLTRSSIAERIVWVVPGAYDIRYRWVRGSVGIPLNRDRAIGVVDILPSEVDGTVQDIAVDIPMGTLTGTFRFDGDAALSSPTDYGAFTLVDVADARDTVDLGDTRVPEFATNVIPGTYDTYYSWRAGSTLFPQNKWSRLDPVTVEGPGEVARDVEVSTILATGDITLGGAAPPPDESDDGVLSLRNADGDHVVLGNTRLGSYSTRIIPGTYEVYYSQETPGASMPANTNALLPGESGGFTTTGAHPIDIDVVTVTGTILVDGEIPPDSEYDDGRLYLRNAGSGDSVLLGNTRLAGFTRRVVPGTYDVVYVVESPGADIPANTDATVLAAQPVDGDAPLQIDIAAGRIRGDLLVGGQAPAGGGATVVLQDVVSDDEVLLGTLGAPSFDLSLARGRYLARYRGGSDAYQAPVNEDAAFACFDIDGN